jgi:hypothetical protein
MLNKYQLETADRMAELALLIHDMADTVTGMLTRSRRS